MNINTDQARAMIEMDIFFDILKTKYPEILDDMLSWKTNYNCGCGKRFVDFLNQKYINNEDKIFLDSILSNQDFKKKKDEITQKNLEAYNKRLFHGKIIKVDKTEQSWENLSQELARLNPIYRAVFVLDRGENLEVRFL